jgi:chemotaxis regulatin CheY-phosphate phosphatase CheZ
MADTAPNQPTTGETETPDRVQSRYEVIEATLMRSQEGRAFLSEYARRNRAADTEMLLEAIARLEHIVRRPQNERDNEGVWGELIEMSEAIARMRREIAAIKPPSQIIAATVELEQVVSATEQATLEILQAAEDVQEVAWTLREKGVEADACEMLDQRATEIYTACSFQDITGQRMEKVVKVLHFIEQRLNAMIEACGTRGVIDETLPSPEKSETQLLNGPRPEGEGLKQDDVDRVLIVSDAAADALRDVQQVLAVEPLALATLDETKSKALFG